MRRRMLLTVAVSFSASPLFAQVPKAPIVPGPLPMNEPGRLPPGFGPQLFPQQPHTLPRAAVAPPSFGATEHKTGGMKSEVKLPHPEQIVRIEGSSLIARRQNENWQIWSGPTLLREFGKHQSEAEEMVRQMRELRPTEWVGIGSGRPVIEYGLTKGEAFVPTYEPKHSQQVDLKTVRAESLRGAWVLRDDDSILLNFGVNRADAEQAAAVAQRYGFNRIGWVGDTAPIMTYFFAMPGQRAAGGGGLAAALKNQQEQSLTRTGIDVAGLGFVGERIVIDAKKCEIRKEKSEYHLVHGMDVLAKFGPSEWSARDALKVVQDIRATEFCRFNADITFFLVNGAAPTRVPFAVQATRFDAQDLKVRPASGGKFALYDATHRQIFGPFATQVEAEQLVKLLKHYKFDQTCQQGLSSRGGLKFLAKQGR